MQLVVTLSSADLQQHKLTINPKKTNKQINEQMSKYTLAFAPTRLEVHTGIATTGVVGVLRSDDVTGGGVGTERTVGFRADMDALPMEEANDFPHRP
jgi:metal-dependent amidase/aminoacylase/carboxypeptidase family protein